MCRVRFAHLTRKMPVVRSLIPTLSGIAAEAELHFVIRHSDFVIDSDFWFWHSGFPSTHLPIAASLPSH
jgi:hypothetical protein